MDHDRPSSPITQAIMENPAVNITPVGKYNIEGTQLNWLPPLSMLPRNFGNSFATFFQIIACNPIIIPCTLVIEPDANN